MKKRFLGLVIAAVMAVTLIGGCITAFAAGVNAVIETIDAKPGQNTAVAFVGLETNGTATLPGEYFIQIFDGDEYIGASKKKITATGYYDILLMDDHVFGFEKEYTAKLYFSSEGEVSHATEVFTLPFNPEGAIIQHVEAKPCTTEGIAYIAGAKDGETYFVEIFKEGEDEFVGTTEYITGNGPAEVCMNPGNIFEPEGSYTAKLYKFLPDSGSMSEMVYELDFNPEGVVMEHIKAVEGNEEAVLYVSGVKENTEHFVEIFNGDEMVGTTENIVENGEQTIYFDGKIQKDVLYEAKLFVKNGLKTEYIYSLTFDAEAAKVPVTNDSGNMALWIVIAVFGAAGILYTGKKLLQK